MDACVDEERISVGKAVRGLVAVLLKRSCGLPAPFIINQAQRLPGEQPVQGGLKGSIHKPTVIHHEKYPAHFINGQIILSTIYQAEGIKTPVHHAGVVCEAIVLAQRKHRIKVDGTLRYRTTRTAMAKL